MKSDIIEFRDDTTQRLSCRSGQYLLWLQPESMFAAETVSDWKRVVDFWELKDGDCVTVTNRLCDLPAWFELYPGEIGGIRTIHEFQPRLDAQDYPDQPMDGANLWRVPAGARLVWVDVDDEDTLPVLEVIDVGACVLVIGENSSPSMESMGFFGTPQRRMSPDIRHAWGQGVIHAASLGTPRIMTADEWRFGA